MASSVKQPKEEKPPERPVRKMSSFGSFPSLSEDQTVLQMVEVGKSDKQGDSAPDAELENAKLREQLAHMKVKIALLQSRLKQSVPAGEAGPTQSTPSKSKKRPILFKLPDSLRQASLMKRNRSNEKEHQSGPTDDEHDGEDGSSKDPNDHDIEMHVSSKGLHHRVPTGNTPHSSPSRTPRVALDEDLESLSASIDDDDDAEDTERQRLIVQGNSPQAQPIRGDINQESFWGCIQERAGWLVGLMVLQSMSSFIIARNEKLLKDHAVIVQFLTMLVGAGGNAGNQASVRVIRGLAVGTVNERTRRRFLRRELAMGVCLSFVLGVAGCVRAVVFSVPLLETIAITASLTVIVIISIIIGAVLPLLMHCVGIDAAHSSTTIQVIMDILGVTISVNMSRLVLDSQFQFWLRSAFSDAR